MRVHCVRIKFIGFNLLNEMSITLLVCYSFALLIIQLNLIQPTVSVPFCDVQTIVHK